MISANACSGAESPEPSAVSVAPEPLDAARDWLLEFVLAGFSFELTRPLACLAAAPALKGPEEGTEIGVDAAAGRLAGGKVTLSARQSADQTPGNAISICYEITLRHDFAESRDIAKFLAVALALPIELIASGSLILSGL
jgi:hypothetical protein